MARKNLASFLSTLDSTIKSGAVPYARQLLRNLRVAEVPASSLADLAALAIRAGDPSLAVRWLSPLVRPTRKDAHPPTNAQTVEYAGALIKIGAVDEGLALLMTSVPETMPQALTYQVAGLMAQWRYDEAIPVLHRYLALEEITDYQRAIAKANLLSAYVHERTWEHVPPLLELLLAPPMSREAPLLWGQCLQFAAEYEIHRKQWARAEAHLHRAATALKLTGGLQELFVDKWKLIARILRPGKMPSNGDLATFRQKAREHGHWETLRDLDYHIAVGRGDRGRLWRVYFGTRYEHYQFRLLEDARWAGAIPPTFVWTLREATNPVLLDTDTGTFQGRKSAQLRLGSTSHRLLIALTSDFYRPCRLATLHALLYPQQYFNPFTSPFRVYEATHRLNLWLRRMKIPLTVSATNGHFHLNARAGVNVQVSSASRRRLRADGPVEILATRAGQASFSTAEASQWLGMPPRSASRLIQSACEKGALRRIGKGKKVRYAFGS